MSQLVSGELGTLHQMVEALASRVVLADDGPDEKASMLAALEQLSGVAGVAGYEELSAAASRLASSVDCRDDLSQGIAALQLVIEDARRRERDGGASPEPGGAEPDLDAEPDQEMMREFLAEAHDHLAQIEAHVLTLEHDPGNQEAVHATFRGFHTVKGLAGFLELFMMQRVAHEVETLLDRVRSNSLQVTPALVDVVLAGADYLKQEVARVEGGAMGDPASPEPVLQRVAALLEAKVETVPPPSSAAIEPQGAAEPPARTSPSSEARIVKVDTAKLDFLVDMVGELVIAQSMIRHDGELSAVANPQLQRNLARLSRITGEVQKTAMSMRMVPVGQLFQKSVRLVRDLTRKSGKHAEVDLSGEETELDRTIVEDLSDPLVHMIRNAADHGIETPEERQAAGKNPVARIGLKAYHQAGHIVIEVSDDGRGLSREKILAKARERGLIQDGADFADREVFGLIFEPGFSTAERVTDVSGRGVGMDVVRRQLEKMRGHIDIDSKPGHGTTFFLKLPLTLAIIDGLVVSVGRERYIVPIFAVREIFRPQPEAVFTVEGRDEMIRVRGRLLPVVRLHRRFSVTPRAREIPDGVVVVAESGGKRYGLLVDELIGKQEVVIKSLGEQFRHVAGLAGGAILGDGRVGLILDMEGLSGWGAKKASCA
jgi:two-component system chemotaxis sensor kinase CheA